MANNKINIDPVDEALKLVYLSSSSNESEFLDASVQLKNIISVDYESQPSNEASSKMIDKLYEKLSVDSLGVLITNAVSKANVKREELAEKSNLPVSTIEQLQADKVLANSIPVISFRNLLKSLQIPFDKAEKAINKTFQILKNEFAFSPATLGSLQLSYRRRNASVATSFNTKASKSESQYLFQNEEALQKYLKRLKELYEINE